jgi:ELWxxDGT repeat protein
MAANTTNTPLVPVVVTTEKIMHNINQLINVDGTVYFEGDAYDGKGSELYKLDANDKPVLVGQVNTSFNGSNIGMITNVKGIVYFNANDGTKQGLYRVDPKTGVPARLSDMIIFTANTQNGISANIVNIGDNDYFLANRGDKQLWKIDRISGVVSKVIPTGLPANFSFEIGEPSTGNDFRAVNNSLAVGGSLYFRGNGQVWKFDPTTNNASPISIPNQVSYFPGELHQLGNTLFFKTNSNSSGQELYQVDGGSGTATLASDPKFASGKYVIDDNNFVDVDGVIHFTTNYGGEIWKLDPAGKAILAGTIKGAGVTSEPVNFTSVNGTLYFIFDDGINKGQVWKLNSDSSVAAVTTIAPNPTYQKTFVENLTAIGDKLYFTANDQQYGEEVRELDPLTGTMTTLDISAGLYGSDPASSSLGSKIINVNGTPYFASSVKPDGVSYYEDRIFKIASAETIVPNPVTPVTPTTPVVTPPTTTPVTPTTPVVTPPTTTPVTSTPPTTPPTPFTPTTPVTPIEPAIIVTAVDKTAAETKTGETANSGQFLLTRKGDVSAAQEVSYLLSGSATNGTDYQKLTGKATFAAGATTTTVDIKNIVDDKIYEGNETVFLSIVPNDQASGGAFKIVSNLSNDAILNKLLGDTTGLSNINLTVTGNREAYGTFDGAPFDIDSGIVLSTGKVTDLAGVNNSSGTTGSFGLSDPDSGFDPITLKIDFNTDNNSRQVFFQYVFGSEEFTDYSGSSFNDLFTLTLNGVNLAKLTDGKTASINNLTPSAQPETWSADYIDNPQSTGPLSGKVILDGYTKTLTFAGTLLPNAKNTLEIKIKDVSDGALDSAVFLKGGSLGVVDPATLANAITIADNDPAPVVSVADVSFNEGKDDTSTGTFTVALSNPSSLITTIDYATADGTAIAGIDYTKVDKTTLSFAPGEISKTIVIPLIGDLVDEADKAFKINLSNPTGDATLGNITATGTIRNDDTPISIAITDANVAETKPGETANPGQFVITRGGDLTKPVTVKYKLSGGSTNGEDYQALTGTSIFAAGVDKAVIDINPIDDQIYESADNVTFSVEANDYQVNGANSVTVKIANNDPIDPKLISTGNNVLSVNGGTAQALVKFSKKSAQGKERSEILAFLVDDDLGQINGIKPGESGYLAAAIDRAQTIFSTLGNSDFDKQNDGNSSRYFNITPGKKFEFVEIVDDTLDGIKSDLLAGKPTAKVIFSNSTNAVNFNAIPAKNSYEVDFKDLVLKVDVLDNLAAPIGNGLQGKSQGQLIDLRSYTNNSQATFDTKTIGEASYNNFIALYEVEDEAGTLANGLKPTDVGYAEAAIKSAVLATIFKSQVDKGLTLQGGKILAPVVVANGTFNDFLKNNPLNKADSKVHAYFNYIGANTDKVDHFRLLGDNKFGVEDVYGGGDRDYNDLIFQMDIKG